MLKICSFLQKLNGVFAFLDKMTKNMYRTCALVVSAGVVIAAVSFMSTHLAGAGRNNVNAANASNVSQGALEEEGNETTNDMGLQVGLIDDLLFANTNDELISQIEDMGVVLYDVFSADGNKLIEIGEVKKPQPSASVETNNKYLSADNETATVIEFSQEDYIYLLKIVEAEAGICDMKGRILVANVIINRVKDRRFPNTLKGVITQNGNGVYQFTPVQTGSINKYTVKNSTKEAVDRALAGEDYSKGALYFCSTASYNKGNWMRRNLTELLSHDGHVFFR